MKTAFPGIDVSVVYAFLLFTMKSTIVFSAILSLCRFGDHVLSFSRLHGNDSGGSVGLRFSDFLRLFLLFLFIHSFIIYLFYFISFCFIFFLFYVMLFYFYSFIFSSERPTRNRETHSTLSEKERGWPYFLYRCVEFFWWPFMFLILRSAGARPGTN